MIKVLSDNALRAYIPLLPAVKTRTAPSRYVKMLMHHLSMQRYLFFLVLTCLYRIKLSTTLQNAVTLMKKNNEKWGICVLLLVCFFLLAKLCFTPKSPKGDLKPSFRRVWKVELRNKEPRFYPQPLKLLHYFALCTIFTIFAAIIEKQPTKNIFLPME